MSTGQVFVMGSDTPSGWEAEEIVYYKLGVTLSGGLQFVYLPGSGVAKGGDIDAFIVGLLAGKPPGAIPFARLGDAPNLIIRKSCYVVLQLDPSLNWQYLSDEPGLMTVEDLPGRYFDLTQVAMDGKETEGEAPPAGAVCQIAYFGALAQASEQGRIDPYNLYVELTTDPKQTIPIIVDPDIKNDGTNPNWP
ncbi:MAG TPA: nucleotide synthetase [Rhizomicrobium sp.]